MRLFLYLIATKPSSCKLSYLTLKSLSWRAINWSPSGPDLTVNTSTFIAPEGERHPHAPHHRPLRPTDPQQAPRSQGHEGPTHVTPCSLACQAAPPEHDREDLSSYLLSCTKHQVSVSSEARYPSASGRLHHLTRCFSLEQDVLQLHVRPS